MGDPVRELIRIEGRARRHGEHVAVVGIEGDDRPGAIAQRLLRRALQIEVDGEHESVPGQRFLLVEDAQLASERVDLDLLAAVDATQLLVADLLQTRLADQVTGAIERVALQVLTRDLADVAEHVRQGLALRGSGAAG